MRQYATLVDAHHVGRMLRFAGCLLLGLGAARIAPAQAVRPNVIVIYSDDVGFQEFGFQGSTSFSTPNLDALALAGTRFTNGYVASSVCAPSRASLLTGQHSLQFGFEFNPAPDPEPTIGLPQDRETIADRLKGQGYSTGAIGKWQMGKTEGVFQPLDRGFDEFYGFLGGFHDYFAEETEDVRLIRRGNTPEATWAEEGRYLTDVFGDEAAAFIDNHAPQSPADDPFFLYLAPNAAHGPLQAKQEDLDAFPDLDGNEKIRAAMVLALDRMVGTVMDKLEEKGVADNTIIVFSNDNGGETTGDEANNGTLRGGKSSPYEGGVRVPLLISGPGFEPNAVFDAPVSTFDILPTLIAATGGVVPGGLDGVNLLPYLSDSPPPSNPHDTLHWRFDGTWAIRDGDWKLLRPEASTPISQLELYHLASDPSESNNLAGSNSTLVQDLVKKFTDWEVQLPKPKWGPNGSEVNEGDLFKWRQFQKDSLWSDPEIWKLGGPDGDPATLQPLDSYANTVLQFRVDQENYISTNDLARGSGLTFMLNQIVLDGEFAGDHDTSAMIRGNAVMFVPNLDGQGPQLRLEATGTGGANEFTFDLDLGLVLYDDLEITGNGTQRFQLDGSIRQFADPVNVVKTGTSKVIFGGASNYTGDLIVNQGEVEFAGSRAALNRAGQVVIGSEGTVTLSEGLIRVETFDNSAGGTFNFEGGTLKAVHFLGELVNEGGTYAAGNSVAASTISGDYVQLSDATLSMEIGGLLQGVEYDHLDILGDFTAAGTFEIRLIGSYVPQLGDSFDLFDFGGSVSGRFNLFHFPSIGGGLGWDTSALYKTGTVSVFVQPVPEPSTFVLWSVLGAFLFRAVRRRRNRRG